MIINKLFTKIEYHNNQKSKKAGFMKIFTTMIIAIFVPIILFAEGILVSVNGKEITIEDAKFFVLNTLPNTTYEELSFEQKEMVKNRLIEKALFAQEAIRDGIEKNREFQMHAKRIKEDLLVNMWIKEQLENTVVSDSEAYDFYRANQARFTEPTLMHLRHIVVKDKQEATSIILALTPLADETLQNTFISLAQEKSIATTAQDGGDMGFVQTNQLDPQILALVKNLRNNEIAKELYFGADGYHIFYLEETSLPKTVPYTKVKESILVTLKQKQLSSHLIEVAKELKSQAEITVPNSEK